jgi:folate-dependent phosphoribosylglycinamide formyltransferase PurN
MIPAKLENILKSDDSVVIVTANNYISRLMVTNVLQNKSKIISAVILLPNFTIFEKKSRKLTKKWITKSSPSFAALKFCDIFVDSVIAKIRRRSIPDICKSYGVKRVHLKNQTQLFNYLRESQSRPTLLISMGPVILSKNVIEYPTRGSVNVHGGRIPEYRGLGNYVWMLANNETVATATLHILEEGIDTGSVVLTKDLFIEETWSAFKLNQQMASAMARLTCQYLELTESEVKSAIKIQGARVPLRNKYHSAPDSIAVKLLRQKGKRMFRATDFLLFFQ